MYLPNDVPWELDERFLEEARKRALWPRPMPLAAAAAIRCLEEIAGEALRRADGVRTSGLRALPESRYFGEHGEMQLYIDPAHARISVTNMACSRRL